MRGPPLRLFYRQEAFEQETVGRKAAHRERCQERRRAGQGGDAVPPLPRLAHELVARIGNKRRSGIADQGDCVSLRETSQQFWAYHCGIMFVIGANRRRSRNDQGACGSCAYPRTQSCRRRPRLRARGA